jgi:hypothetical protein
LNKKIVITILIIIISCIIIVGLYLIFEFNEVSEIKEPVTIKKIDNRISPFLSQGLTVEILRIRNRGLLEKMLKIGTSWKKPPVYYWISNVDGEIGDTSAIEAAGGVAGEGTFNEWDNILKECRVNYKVDDEQLTSDITISIMEIQKKGLFGRQEERIEKESIHLTYDYRTGHWTGSDYLGDKDGYGHYLGKEYEIWFNIYQSDYDHDAIPFWTEVNIYDTDPTIDDSELDPDNDGIPSSWEWKYGYDPNSYDNHKFLDPDMDGIENIEEYMLAKYFSDPFSPDIYIETDGMKKGGLLDWEHIFYKESQQMVIERLAQHGINVYIDDGWPDGPVNGGGEMLDFVETLDEVVGGHMSRWYKHNFAEERKKVFRYLIVANNAGFITASEYNYYDHIVVDTSLYKTYFKRFAFTPRFQRVVLAKGVLHELGHSLGLCPWTFYGIDNMPGGNMRWPETLTDEEYKRYNEEYKSVMNYNYIFNALKDRHFFDYSYGENGKYDFDDWDHIYVPAFQVDTETYEEPIDETFEDFEIINKEPEPVYDGWEYNENLTKQFKQELFSHKYDIDNARYEYRLYVKTTSNGSDRNIRVYVKPLIKPVVSVWSLIAEAELNIDGEIIEFYSYNDLIDEVLKSLP